MSDINKVTIRGRAAASAEWKQGWMPDHVADAILEEAGIDADKELQRAMDTVARYDTHHRVSPDRSAGKE